jgi:hypothetical protein
LGNKIGGESRAGTVGNIRWIMPMLRVLMVDWLMKRRNTSVDFGSVAQFAIIALANRRSGTGIEGRALWRAHQSPKHNDSKPVVVSATPPCAA